MILTLCIGLLISFQYHHKSVAKLLAEIGVLYFKGYTYNMQMRAYTQTNVKLDPHPGGSFSWFNGSVVGEFLELEADKKIVMKWKFNTWKEECFSKVANP
jgi:hypothetical protein